MKIIIIEDCTADELDMVLNPTIGHRLSELIHAAKTMRVTEEQTDEAIIPDPVITTEPDPEPEHESSPEPEPEPDTEPEPEAAPEVLPKKPVGHTRAWQPVENDVVAKCSSWPLAVEAYQKAFPESLRTAHAVENRWYHLRSKGLLVDQPEKITSDTDLQPETDAAEVTTLCDCMDWPEHPGGACEVTDDKILKKLMRKRCQADIPADGGNTKYVKGVIRKVMTDRTVLIECDSGAMCWCSLDCISLLGGVE